MIFSTSPPRTISTWASVCLLNSTYWTRYSIVDCIRMERHPGFSNLVLVPSGPITSFCSSFVTNTFLSSCHSSLIAGKTTPLSPRRMNSRPENKPMFSPTRAKHCNRSHAVFKMASGSWLKHSFLFGCPRTYPSEPADFAKSIDAMAFWNSAKTRSLSPPSSASKRRLVYGFIGGQMPPISSSLKSSDNVVAKLSFERKTFFKHEKRQVAQQQASWK